METTNYEPSLDERLQHIRETFIHELSTNLHLYGMNESTGRLYGALLFEENALTLDEMSDHLGMSKTSMSTSIRQLTEANMARKVWQKGVRKDLYTSEDDWYSSFIAIFTKQWRTAIERNRKASVEMEQELRSLLEKAPHLTDQIKIDLIKLQHANGYYDWIDDFVTILESGEIFKTLPKK
ncbi:MULTISPECIES: GbsR/MarR family transcriptional regulator [Shouchella]|uniref:HTH-type transcriptional regulator n=2 Tax=Bacillaceae TaxID=186817 RepID=A0A060LZA0_9BACI|nr:MULTISPECIES: transcriptional regulator [Bacillaceae]AIC93623.1 HTH-type transcriptional regulator [Shouchella lehensis G1]KQL56410.1 transcriptional regulator [Alkalicoccobacillus plakortidis]RQW21861.1 GbsR/MarR family transcriptional regulator [Bacillus sp. C1-1]